MESRPESRYPKLETISPRNVEFAQYQRANTRGSTCDHGSPGTSGIIHSMNFSLTKGKVAYPHNDHVADISSDWPQAPLSSLEPVPSPPHIGVEDGKVTPTHHAYTQTSPQIRTHPKPLTAASLDRCTPNSQSIVTTTVTPNLLPRPKERKPLATQGQANGTAYIMPKPSAKITSIQLEQMAPKSQRLSIRLMPGSSVPVDVDISSWVIVSPVEVPKTSWYKRLFTRIRLS